MREGHFQKNCLAKIAILRLFFFRIRCWATIFSKAEAVKKYDVGMTESVKIGLRWDCHANCARNDKIVDTQWIYGD